MEDSKVGGINQRWLSKERMCRIFRRITSRQRVDFCNTAAAKAATAGGAGAVPASGYSYGGGGGGAATTGRECLLNSPEGGSYM